MKMQNKNKFKKGDIVYVIAYIDIDYSLGKIVRFDEEKNMYVMIQFLDILDPESFWCWSYVKEEDIDYAEKVLKGADSYKKYFAKDMKLWPRDYLELYTEEYGYAKLFHEGKIERQEYYDKVDELYSKESKNRK